MPRNFLGEARSIRRERPSIAAALTGNRHDSHLQLHGGTDDVLERGVLRILDVLLCEHDSVQGIREIKSGKRTAGAIKDFLEHAVGHECRFEKGRNNLDGFFLEPVGNGAGHSTIQCSVFGRNRNGDRFVSHLLGNTGI